MSFTKYLDKRIDESKDKDRKKGEAISAISEIISDYIDPSTSNEEIDIALNKIYDNVIAPIQDDLSNWARMGITMMNKR